MTLTDGDHRPTTGAQLSEERFRSDRCPTCDQYAIERSFVTPPPPELLKTTFERRVALGMALGLVPAEQRPLFKVLANLRNGRL